MRRFLGLTRAFGGATKRCKKSSLVVSLLSNCLPQCASEAADLPGRAGLLSRLRALTCNTPPTPGGGNVTVFTSFLFCHLPKSKGCDYFSTTPKWLGISGIAGSVGSVGPSKCRAIKIASGFRSIGACQLLLGQVRKRRSRQSFHPPEKQPQLTILADGVSIERRHFRVEF